MQTKTKRESGEVTLTITIPAKKVKETFTKIKEEALKEVSAPGFRKGKAPKKIAEKHLDEDKLSEALFNQLVPPAYADAVKKEEVSPIIPPQLKILSFKKDKELVFEAKTAERPKVNLGNYKAALKKLKGRIIYGPDDKPLKGGVKITAAQVLEKLRETVELVIPPILIEQEVQRMLSSLLEQSQTLGITVEQYLASQGKTADQLRKEYREMAERTLKDEFIITKITKEGGIKVAPREIEEAISAAPDEKTRENFRKDYGRRYIEDILRKRKTIEFLIKLVEESKQ